MKITWKTIVFIETVIGAAGAVAILFYSLHTSRAAKQLSQETAQQTASIISGLNKSPFQKNSDTLDWIQVNNGPKLKPDIHAVIVHQCSIVAFGRSANVIEDFTAFLTKNFRWSGGGGLNLPPGGERFTVKNNPNPMRPVFIIPSNLPHYRYIIYNVTVQDESRFAPDMPLQVVVFYIINHDDAIPQQGDPAPRPKPDTDDPLECPTFTTPSSPPSP